MAPVQGKRVALECARRVDGRTRVARKLYIACVHEGLSFVNVLFHCGEFPPLGGGVGAYMRQMAMALVQEGHQAAVLTARSDGLPDDEHVGGVRVMRRYDRRESGRDGSVQALKEAIRSLRPDVIEGADHLGECAPLLRASHETPILIKAHACQVVRVLQEAHIHYSWQRLIWQLARARARTQMRNEIDSIRRADLLLCPSRRLLDELDRQGVALPEGRGVVPNPIADPGEGRQEATCPTLLFVGRLEFLKGIACLPDLLAAVSRAVPDVRLELVGDDTYARGVGSLKRWLDRRWGTNADRVSYLGRLNGDALDAAYRRAWVLVAPSLWDNFPTVVLEAMIRGTCVVTTPDGGMPEMLAGTGVPTHDPHSTDFVEDVKTVLQDDALRASRGRSLRDRAMRAYSPAVVVSDYLAFLKGKL